MGDISRGDEISLIRGGDFEIGDNGVSAETSIQVVIEDVTPITLMPFEDDDGLVLGVGSLTITRSTIGTFDNKNTGIVETAAIDIARFEKEGRLMEGESENKALHNRDFTDIVWAKSVSMGAVKNATGANGVANAASTLTASAANQTALQTVTIVSAEFTYAIDIRRKTGGGVIEITDDGSTFTPVSINSSTYTRFPLTTNQANPVFGVRIVDSGDEIEVDYAQLEALDHASSRIETAGSPVTRAKELSIISASNWPTVNADFSISVIIDKQNISSDVQVIHITGLASNVSLGSTGGKAPRFRYAGVSSLGTTLFNSNPQKLTGTWEASGNQKLYVDSSLEKTDANADATGSVAQITIGSTDSGGAPLYGHIRDFRIYDVVLTDSQVIAT